MAAATVAAAAAAVLKQAAERHSTSVSYDCVEEVFEEFIMCLPACCLCLTEVRLRAHQPPAARHNTHSTNTHTLSKRHASMCGRTHARLLVLRVSDTHRSLLSQHSSIHNGKLALAQSAAVVKVSTLEPVVGWSGRTWEWDAALG